MFIQIAFIPLNPKGSKKAFKIMIVGTITESKIKALIKTKSNYKNLNGQWLEVIEMADFRVSCKVFFEEFGRYNIVDFHLKEVQKLNSN